MNIGDRVNWRINCLNEDHFGTIIGKSRTRHDLFFVAFDDPVVGTQYELVKARNVLEKDLEIVEQ